MLRNRELPRFSSGFALSRPRLLRTGGRVLPVPGVIRADYGHFEELVCVRRSAAYVGIRVGGAVVPFPLIGNDTGTTQRGGVSRQERPSHRRAGSGYLVREITLSERACRSRACPPRLRKHSKFPPLGLPGSGQHQRGGVERRAHGGQRAAAGRSVVDFPCPSIHAG